MTSIQAQKLVLRDKIRERVRALDGAQREAASRDSCGRLSRQPRWEGAQTILGYAPLAAELDVWPLLMDALKARKRVFLPRFVGKSAVIQPSTRSSEPGSGTYVACEIISPEKDLRTGRFGIREPADWCPEFDLKRLDFTLVPGVAFDLQGRRLGRGKGFYDRMLAAVRGTICGVAFDEQIVEEIPIEPHDTLVNCILTPTRWVEL